ncbi:flagella basal body P-ring formation protein FlgA [Photobacterium gaetbulicola]|uniref:Flagella basal body P-ring formation protein FlgA n=1 Tax=Photobacterium gaetbulicola Gung47 TaxID=658445 RepID=A0A0C5WNA0_9GAMM|nr:flagellar basal body P-ring formation chaperone FlgA [Photobacterium gaetbulicola]AJR07792.1 putative SAF domain-containing protein [Photobacterium gaetbulicola Gung47]PSU03412.1 flagella basal body P-ring formation protein FlgA [Photobacterium gaetbulicola]
MIEIPRHSALIALLLTLSLASRAGEPAKPKSPAPAEAQIMRQVSQAIERAVNHAAKLHRWPPATPEITLRLPSGSHRLVECPSALDIERIDRRRYPAGRLRFAVSCPQPDSWQLTVQADVNVTVPVAFAARTVSKDAVLNAEDITLKATNIATINREFIASPKGYLGQRALRQIRRGQQLSPSHLSPAYLVAAGDKVIIQASNGEFSATMPGIALEGGYGDQQIRVRNTSSGKVIKAAITKPGLVTTLF